MEALLAVLLSVLRGQYAAIRPFLKTRVSGRLSRSGQRAPANSDLKTKARA